ncbi:MAG: gliding motility-associated ABC transporter substrate-binding protein GldG, partial [Flavobacteriales bacterium]|nr:gliding motility-associated ABC transporter substrate-binding protein GldG [Flavobacteriales bacterium]
MAALFVISGSVFKRYDITEEKRHSLTPSTVELLEGLDDVVFIKCYLKGDHPAEFKQLSRSIEEKLDEMAIHAGSNLQFEFVDPSASSDEKTRNEIYQKLTEDGLKYTSIEIFTNDARIEKIIFPGALVTYKEKTLPLQILKGGFRTPTEIMMSNAINNLEYELAHIIRKVQKDA